MLADFGAFMPHGDGKVKELHVDFFNSALLAYPNP
jgi:hypothetical protein